MEAFKLNQVSTVKYNIITFFPKNILLQFCKMAYLYFLILLCMELIPEITDDGSIPPVLTMPLTFVVGLSMLKDAYEDIMRHRSDKEENNRNSKVIKAEKS